MKKWWGAVLAIFAVVTGYVCYCWLRPLDITATLENLSAPSAREFTLGDLNLDRAAVGYIDPTDDTIVCRALGSGSEYDVPRATASIAKLITVQVVLDKYPLTRGGVGPVVTMTADDEAKYWHHVRTGGSYGRVVAGEQITERQLIEGVLLASANNMADTLAIWAFGSLDNYHQAARQWLADNNLTSTTVGGDASGLDPSTTSTPLDICKIMLLATKQDALVEIMGQKSATMPTGDVLENTNRLLGQNGIFAGKTGYNDQAGRGLAVAARQAIDDMPVTVAAVSLSHDSYPAAFEAVTKLTEQLPHNLGIMAIERNGQVGELQLGWHNSATSLVAGQPLFDVYWIDASPTLKYTPLAVSSEALSRQTVVGRLELGGQAVDVLPGQSVGAAMLNWRLLHPW